MVTPKNPIALVITGLFLLAPVWAATPAAAPAAGAAPAAKPAAAAVPAGDVLAQAGSLTLTSADVRTLVSGMAPNDRETLATSLPTLEQLVRAELVRRAALAEAKAKGFEHQPATVAQLDQVRDEALVRLWVAAQAVVPANYPSEAEVQSAYDQYKTSLAPPTQYRIAQIFISAPDGMDSGQLAAALKKEADIAAKLPSADFAQLAQTQSEHAESAAKGGDMGFLAEDRMVPAIAAAVRSLKVGAVAGPIKTTQGLHFLKLLEIKPGVAPPLAEVHDRLVGALRNERANTIEKQYLADYTTKLNVTVNQIELAKLQQSLPH